MIGKAFAHFVKVAIGTALPQTQTTEMERGLLARELPSRKRIVEIGVFEGFTTKVLADSSDPDATVYGVDPFLTGRLGICWGLLIAKRYNWTHLVSGKLRLVREYSTQVKDAVPQNVDFVFIDGDHSLEAITADWAFWRSRVVPGGIIALHDTLLTPDRHSSGGLGSHRYFESHIRHDPQFRIVAQVDSLSLLQKRNEAEKR